MAYDSFRCSSNSDQTSNRATVCAVSSATASTMALHAGAAPCSCRMSSGKSQARQIQLAMFGVAIGRDSRCQERGNCLNPSDDLPRLIDPSHVGIAGSKCPIGGWKIRIVLDRQDEFRNRLIETPAQEQRGADHREDRAEPTTWA